MDGKELSVLGVVVVPLIGLICWVVKTVIAQNQEFERIATNHMASTATHLVTVGKTLEALLDQAKLNARQLARLCRGLGEDDDA